MALTRILFETKLIKFTNVFMYNYDIKMSREKIKETNASSSNKWQVSNTITLVNILSLCAHSNIWQMACKMEKHFFHKEGSLSILSFMCAIYELKSKQGIQI